MNKKQQIIKLLKEGEQKFVRKYTYRQIAKKVDVSPNYVYLVNKTGDLTNSNK